MLPVHMSNKPFARSMFPSIHAWQMRHFCTIYPALAADPTNAMLRRKTVCRQNEWIVPENVQVSLTDRPEKKSRVVHRNSFEGTAENHNMLDSSVPGDGNGSWLESLSGGNLEAFRHSRRSRATGHRVPTACRPRPQPLRWRDGSYCNPS